jgi:hypothetical protein
MIKDEIQSLIAFFSNPAVGNHFKDDVINKLTKFKEHIKLSTLNESHKKLLIEQVDTLICTIEKEENWGEIIRIIVEYSSSLKRAFGLNNRVTFP